MVLRVFESGRLLVQLESGVNATIERSVVDKSYYRYERDEDMLGLELEVEIVSNTDGKIACSLEAKEAIM